MNERKPLALQIGKDHFLLRTRGAVLRLAGIRVVNIDHYRGWAEAIRKEKFDFVILCHTLASAERESILALVHAVKPHTPVFLISGCDGCPEGGITGILPSEPQSLVANLPAVVSKALPKYHAEYRLPH